MNKTGYAMGILALSIGFIFTFSGSAQAYLDPGTGSMILQGVLGAVAAIAVAGRIYWQRIKRLFGLRKEETASTNTDKEDEQK